MKQQFAAKHPWTILAGGRSHSGAHGHPGGVGRIPTAGDGGKGAASLILFGGGGGGGRGGFPEDSRGPRGGRSGGETFVGGGGCARGPAAGGRSYFLYS